MHATERLLFATLRGAITGKSPDMGQLLPRDEAARESYLQSLFSLADRHDLAHMVAAVLPRDTLTESLSEKFKYAERLSLYRYAQLSCVAEEVTAILEDAGTPHILLKGAVLSRYYPQPAMRTSCDLDVLVPPALVEAAKDALIQKAGYEVCGVGNHDIPLKTPSGMQVELHFTLLEDEDRAESEADLLLRDVWQHATPVHEGAARHELSDAMFYFYHIAHMAKHVLCGGCGVRPFLDLWLLQSVPQDTAARAALLSRGGLDTFEKTAVTLCRAWFEDGEETALSRQLADYTLGAGVYGSRQNHISVKQLQKGSRARYLLSRIFMPFRELKLLYPSLAKRPYLFPLYQLRRWGRILFCGGIQRTVREVRQTAANEASNHGMRSFFADLGLHL